MQTIKLDLAKHLEGVLRKIERVDVERKTDAGCPSDGGARTTTEKTSYTIVWRTTPVPVTPERPKKRARLRDTLGWELSDLAIALRRYGIGTSKIDIEWIIEAVGCESADEAAEWIRDKIKGVHR